MNLPRKIVGEWWSWKSTLFTKALALLASIIALCLSPKQVASTPKKDGGVLVNNHPTHGKFLFLLSPLIKIDFAERRKCRSFTS